VSSLGRENKKIHIFFFLMCSHRNSSTDFIRQNDILVVVVHIFFSICFHFFDLRRPPVEQNATRDISKFLRKPSCARLALQVEKVKNIGKKKNSKK